jgi:CRISPR-associated endonuclease/helicase Cas3
MDLQNYQICAHAKRNLDDSWAQPHLLYQHLSDTATIAESNAAKFASQVFARAAALAHDAGKSTKQWQEYFRQKSGYDDAHLESKPGKLDHSTFGAQLVEKSYANGFGRIIAYCIAGHHAGLPDWDGTQSSLAFRLSKAIPGEVTEEVKKLVEHAEPDQLPQRFGNGIDLSLWIRMLFSSLVDADFLDTEAYMNPETADLRSGFALLSELGKRLDTFLSKKILSEKNTNSPVFKARQQVLDDCRTKATDSTGFYSLTVPTGGGKTLSSLAFALKHAVIHSLSRVIYVIPYTSIIEQNADVFRDALGEESVVEHHSNLDEGATTPQLRLASENWDAPVIVTTAVQFFE